MPRVSVIIPTYNRAWTLREAVDSVLDQDYNDYELIVVDDGSTDETGEILESYGSMVKTVYQKNSGVSAARNTGVINSGGEFLAFLDSDDRWLPEKLSEQVAFFDDNSEISICQTDEVWIRNGKRVNPKNRHKKEGGMIFERSLELCLISPSAVMLKRTLFDAHGGFDESFPACEDYDLWLKICSRNPVGLIEQPHVVKYGGHDDQLSKSPKLDSFRIKSIVNLLEKDALNNSQREKAISVLKAKCRIFAGGCFRRGRIEEGNYYESLLLKY